MAKKKYPVSMCVVSFNEEKHIAACLAAASWVDEIIVVDSFSTDSTLEIARRLATRVFQREWEGYGNQKRYSLGLAKHDWVLFMDADEVMTEELSKEIRKELDKEEILYDGYCVRRKLYYLGRWISRGEWYPDYKLRLFRKSKGSVGGMEPHDSVQLDGGKIKYLKGELLHYSYENIADQMNTLNRYSSISAGAMFKKGVRAPLFRMCVHPSWRFFRAYFLRRGFMDGVPGFAVAAINSFYVFLKYVKLWELYLNDSIDVSSGGRK